MPLSCHDRHFLGRTTIDTFWMCLCFHPPFTPRAWLNIPHIKKREGRGGGGGGTAWTIFVTRRLPVSKHSQKNVLRIAMRGM